MSIWITDFMNIGLAVILVFVNGFFVAAEFAIVKVRPGRLDELIRQGRIFATTARWLLQRRDASLSTCQLGITMASLGLGWIGEPAVAHLLRPLLQSVGVVSEIWMHGIAFAVAFSGITAAHLVLGEQAPKIYALRRPEKILLWCTPPLKFFYFISYPFMIALNSTTSFLLRKIGIEGGSEHETVRSEAEIKALLGQSRQHGELSRYEHRQLKLQLASTEAETLSGLLMEKASRVVKIGDRFELEGAEAEVLEMNGPRASRIQLTLMPGNAPEP